MMSKLEQLAVEIASLANEDLFKLSTMLVRDYPTKADALDSNINAAFFDNDPATGASYEV